MTEDQRTIEDLAREVLAVQDACNLSGVLQAAARAVLRLRHVLPQPWCTDDVNRHPIMMWWSSKIASLTGSEDTVALSRAYAAVTELALRRPAKQSEATHDVP